jgi:hypothetical protein
MKLFIIILMFVNVALAQSLRTQELDGVVLVREENPALIQRKEINTSYTSFSQKEINQIIQNVYINPIPSEPTGGFAWRFDGESFTFCPKAPEPSTNSLMLIGLSSLLFFRRK